MSTPTLTLEIDGKPVQVPSGATVMEAANRLGIYIPHFCYHKKLSIAANCRMCLVEVEKAPKPQPACATPAADGMKVWTHSAQATTAQKGVMEFLLINHPLDCPICDQGGECQLQDLAVGYGSSASRYAEQKRVVLSKDIGPLVAAEEMSRCIHCTRCVRFGQEIAGVMELGMSGRGEHSEILAFVDRTVDSELSGNMIDLCPVGALTSKPFRYAARTWELARRKSVSPHDSLGANLIVQVKQDRVMRVLPLENEDVNECWLSDKDRFSYESLASAERLNTPMVRDSEGWRAVDWQTALAATVEGLARARAAHGGEAIGGLLSPHSTLEELYLAQRLLRGIGSDNVDFRLRESDFACDGSAGGAPWLGCRIAEIETHDRLLFVGGFARKDHPLLAQRIRRAAKQALRVSVLNVVDDDLLLPVASRATVPPSRLPRTLAEIVVAAARVKGSPIPPELVAVDVSPAAEAIARDLAEGRRVAIVLGNLARQHPRASQIHALAQRLAELLAGVFGFAMEAANSVGGYIAGALPGRGLNARAMIESPRRAYLVLHAEPELDCASPGPAMAALSAADFVVAMAPFRGRAYDYASVILPVTPFSETSGTFVSCEGRVQSFNAAVRPLGDARPAWKVLRVLGNLLDLEAFDFASSEAVRDAALGSGGLDLGARLSNATGIRLAVPSVEARDGTLERIADVPIYFADPLARRAESLQATLDARPPKARIRGDLLEELGLAEGQTVRIRQGGGEALVPVVRDESVAPGCVRLAAAHPLTAGLDGLFGPLTVERA